MPTIFNPNNRKGVFFIPAGATQSPSAPAFSNTKSIDFDGINDWIEGSSKTNITTAISVSCWVKTTTTGLTQAFVTEDRASGTNRNWLLYMTSSNKVCFLVWHTGGTITQLIRATANEVTDGSWHNIVATWDGTTNANQFKLFVDGNEENKTATNTGIRNTSPYPISVGAAQEGAGNRYTGLIDEVAVWDSAIVIGDVWDGSGKAIDLSPSSPFMWWRMGDGDTFPTISDHGSSGITGAMTNQDAGDIVNDAP